MRDEFVEPTFEDWQEHRRELARRQLAQDRSDVEAFADTRRVVGAA